MSSSIRRYASSEHTAIPSRPASGTYSLDERRLWIEKGKAEAEEKARDVLLDLARQFMTADQVRDLDTVEDLALLGKRIATAIHQGMLHISWHE